MIYIGIIVRAQMAEPGLNLSINGLDIRQFLENMRKHLNIWITMLSYEKCTWNKINTAITHDSDPYSKNIIIVVILAIE